MNRTKKIIADAFWQLLEEKPYSKITVQNLAERCEINRNTFYYHFQDIPALAEYSIKGWADQVIRNNYGTGTPISCITPAVQEIVKRRTAFIHIYRSVQREAFMRYLDEISLHVVKFYIESITEKYHLSQEDRDIFIKFYKCTFTGIVLDWLDAGAAYDLLGFYEKSCRLFEGAGKRAILKQTDACPDL